MKTQFSQPATIGSPAASEESLDSAKPAQGSIETARGFDTRDWTVEETLKVVNELRAKCLRKLQLAETAEFADEPALYRPSQTPAKFSRETDKNMNSTATPADPRPANDEIAVLQRELLETRARAELAAERLDKAEHRLEGAAILIGCLRSRIQTLELETDRLEWQCDKFDSYRRDAEVLNKTLQTKLEALREKYNRETDTLNNQLRKALARVSELESSWWHKLKTWLSSSQNVRAGA